MHIYRFLYALTGLFFLQFNNHHNEISQHNQLFDYDRFITIICCMTETKKWRPYILLSRLRQTCSQLNGQLCVFLLQTVIQLFVNRLDSVESVLPYEYDM